jgi:hypothetical protein
MVDLTTESPEPAGHRAARARFGMLRLLRLTQTEPISL